ELLLCGQFIRGEPAQFRHIVVRPWLAREQPALVERVDRRVPGRPVTVGHAEDETTDCDLHPGLLAQLAPDALLERLARLDESARRVPEAEERLDATAAEQHAPRVVE